MKLTKHVILALAAGAGVVTSVVLAFRAGRRCDEILEQLDDEGAGFIKKAKVVAKETAPAAGAMLLTGAAIAAEFTGREKEFKALTAKAERIKNRADKAVESFGEYRKTLTKIDGSEKDAEVIAEITKPELLPDGSDGELVHHWKLDDWIPGQSLEFDASMMSVVNGMSELNRILTSGYLDDQGIVQHSGQPVVSDFLDAINHPELCNNLTDAAGWNLVVMQQVCGRFWIDYTAHRTVSPDGKVTYSLDLGEYPNYDIEETVQELEASGEI